MSKPVTSDPGDLKQWLDLQNQAYQKQVNSLKQISNESKVEAVSVMQSQKYLESVERIEKIRFGLLILTIISLFLYFLYIYYSIRYRFSVMIESIDATISAQQYTGPSGWQTAFAYEYPGFDLLFSNSAIPISFIFGYYSKSFSPYLIKSPGDYLQKMFKLGSTGTIGQGPVTAAQILCEVVGVPNNVQQCSNFCNGPGPSAFSAYVAGAGAAGISGMMIGKYLGGGGAGIGLAVGIGISILNTTINNNQYKQQCKNFGGIAECESGQCV